MKKTLLTRLNQPPDQIGIGSDQVWQQQQFKAQPPSVGIQEEGR